MDSVFFEFFFPFFWPNTMKWMCIWCLLFVFIFYYFFKFSLFSSYSQFFCDSFSYNRYADGHFRLTNDDATYVCIVHPFWDIFINAITSFIYPASLNSKKKIIKKHSFWFVLFKVWRLHKEKMLRRPFFLFVFLINSRKRKNINLDVQRKADSFMKFYFCVKELFFFST